MQAALRESDPIYGMLNLRLARTVILVWTLPVGLAMANAPP
jgi:hypothetical protein